MLLLLSYLKVRVTSRRADKTGGSPELKWRGNKRWREKEEGRGWSCKESTRRKTITYPSCTPRAHFHPWKCGEGEPPLEVCELPPIECVRARIPARVARIYSRRHSRTTDNTSMHTRVYFSYSGRTLSWSLGMREGRFMGTACVRRVEKRTGGDSNVSYAPFHVFTRLGNEKLSKMWIYDGFTVWETTQDWIQLENCQKHGFKYQKFQIATIFLKFLRKDTARSVRKLSDDIIFKVFPFGSHNLLQAILLLLEAILKVTFRNS